MDAAVTLFEMDTTNVNRIMTTAEIDYDIEKTDYTLEVTVKDSNGAIDQTTTVTIYVQVIITVCHFIFIYHLLFRKAFE